MRLLLGNCLEKLAELKDSSVDAVITDPPYGLTSITKRFGKESSAPAQFGKDGSFARLSGGFMGKVWDGSGIEYNLDMWREVYRVLKPGGHLLSFGGSRTYHRMACAIEDAGFEIRDQIMWVYGSGFPKSLNIGKAVDKLQGNEREQSTYIPNDKNKVYGKGYGGGVTDTTKGTSEWEGYGTALKPAHEPIVLARKPLSEKTVAENCLKWGVGGLNIDGCRVGIAEGDEPSAGKRTATFGTQETKSGGDGSGGWDMNKQGRFPANFIHDGSNEVVELFPNSKGSGNARILSRSVKPNQVGWGMNKNEPDSVELKDAGSGSAARFFYCAKASKRERDMGCEGLEEKSIDIQQPHNSKNLEERYAMKSRNNHPTVKPLALMKYLVTLISREGQTVLDPFMGSGTTGIACKELNRNFVGIEKEPEYLEIAKRRIFETESSMFY